METIHNLQYKSEYEITHKFYHVDGKVEFKIEKMPDGKIKISLLRYDDISLTDNDVFII